MADRSSSTHLKKKRLWNWVRGRCPRLEEYLDEKRFFTVLYVVFAFIVYFVIVRFALGYPEVLSVASVVTERIRFVDPSGQGASFPVYGMRTNLGNSCADGWVKTTSAAMVTYGRVGEGPLEISVDPDETATRPSSDAILAIYTPRSGEAQAIKSSTIFQWDMKCAETATEHFPPPLTIWGIVKIGLEWKNTFDAGLPPPRFLLSGKLVVLARSEGWFSGGKTLYPVKEVLLPVASRLEARTERGSSRSAANWWGVAYVEAGKPALKVEVATNAPRLQLYHAGRSDADEISVNLLARISEDPDVAVLNWSLFVILLSIVLFFIDGKFRAEYAARKNEAGTANNESSAPAEGREDDRKEA